MKPTIRDEIEKVLKRWGYDRNCANVNWPNVLNALEALYPQQQEPDREELGKIFAKHWGYSIASHNPVWFNKVADDIYAWARGQKKAERWCSHWEWNQEKKRWRYTQPASGAVEIMHGIFDAADKKETWDICPVKGCHAARPEESS